jgi:hypothetical protein
MRQLIAAALFLILASMAVPSKASPVVWDMVETSCVANSIGSCVGVTTPVTIAHLYLPDINFSGSYSYQVVCTQGFPPCDLQETYSGGFALTVGNTDPRFSLPLSTSYKDHCEFLFTHGGDLCFATLDFTSSANGLSINLREFAFTLANENIAFFGTDQAWTGRSGTDGAPVIGCTPFGLSSCTIAGYAVVEQVPEPSSLSLLFSAMLLGLFVCRPHRQRGATAAR